MIKKIFYIGLALILVAIIVFFVGTSLGSGLSNALAQQVVTQNFTVSSGSFYYMNENITNSSLFFLIAKLSSRANAYMLNGSAFAAWDANINTHNRTATGFTYALGLEGHGAFAIFHNVSSIEVPYVPGQSNSTPTYSYNYSKPYPRGDYYFVVDNTNGSASAAETLSGSALYLPPLNITALSSNTQLGATINESVAIGFAFFILIVAGIAVTIYGYVKKPKEAQMPQVPGAPMGPKQEANKKYIDALYKGLDKKKSGKKRINK